MCLRSRQARRLLRHGGGPLALGRYRGGRGGADGQRRSAPPGAARRAPGVGKTMVARRLVGLLRDAGVPFGGFVTDEIRVRGRREGFMVEAVWGGGLGRLGDHRRRIAGWVGAPLEELPELLLVAADPPRATVRLLWCCHGPGLEGPGDPIAQTLAELFADVKRRLLETVTVRVLRGRLGRGPSGHDDLKPG